MEKEEKRVEARVVEETLEQVAKEQRKVEEEEEGKSLLEQFQVHLKGQFHEFTAYSGSLKALL